LDANSVQRFQEQVLHSASDVVNFLECEHLTRLDRIHLDTPLEKTADGDDAKLIQQKGHEHEARFLERLKAEHGDSVIDIAASGGTLDQKVAATEQAMRNGYQIIFQATLRDGCLIGHADFLRRVEEPSELGAYQYEVLDTKLARSPKAKFLIQLGFYSRLVARVQGCLPRLMHVVLGDQRIVPYRVVEYAHYIDHVLERFLATVSRGDSAIYPNPCEKCAQCHWRERCEAQRLQDDHLCQVANILGSQIQKLNAAGVTTLQALAELPSNSNVPKMAADTLDKLRHQAALQFKARETGRNHLDVLPVDPDGQRGFYRMPVPDAGDLFFDMEGDPLEEGGLEYLFGLYYFEAGESTFKPFWAHNRREEKLAFEAFMDFVTAWLKQHPKAHIYHYAHYEETALKKLMSLHGTREAEVDALLRRRKLVDLYKVVREGIRVSEPRYSIKNIEHFYLEQREGDVTNAGASIVFYERWKETGEAQSLKDIEDYNFDDVRSTYELREWLLTLRPTGLPWSGEGSESAQTADDSPALTPDEEALIPYRERLIDPLPKDASEWNPAQRLAELTFQLMDFHRRAAKPAWWATFARQEMMVSDIIDDIECIGGLTADPDHPPVTDKRSKIYTYRYPEQETKLKSGGSAVFIHCLETVNNLKIDADARRVTFRRVANKEPALPDVLHLGPSTPLSGRILKEAIFRFADSLLAGDDRYPAVEAVLKQSLPRLNGVPVGSPIVPAEADITDIIRAIGLLDRSYMFIQGPPGAGKTYTGSHLIVALMRQGFRVGVSSNSHKAIHNLLDGVEEVAEAEGFEFRGIKKASNGNEDSVYEGRFIDSVYANEYVYGDDEARLVAGTAWLFADEDMDQNLDFLFVDEAGQVALANLVAMGTSARNIVLLGDQMQLGQPIQGVHPGRSGESSLEFLLNGAATIAPERGIFLDTTWRMHPDVCRFISDAVYDSRLEPQAQNKNRYLVLNEQAHPLLMASGVRYIPIEHAGCSQKSVEEARLVSELVQNLLTQQFTDKHGEAHPFTLDNILVVAPYNMQVNLLKETLPEGARVGTVDKFQGQEAEVVIVSMATSSGDDLPRYIEFLFSKNRLNVAISRAKCLALFIVNPALMSIRCSTPEEMALVNTLCWLRNESN
jgi:uncharacterized protein